MAEDAVTEIVLLLREGFGVEDIEVKTGHSAEKIRKVIDRLREIGALDKIYQREGKK